jgi:hypothetical protein
VYLVLLGRRSRRSAVIGGFSVPGATGTHGRDSTCHLNGVTVTANGQGFLRVKDGFAVVVAQFPLAGPWRGRIPARNHIFILDAGRDVVGEQNDAGPEVPLPKVKPTSFHLRRKAL